MTQTHQSSALPVFTCPMCDYRVIPGLILPVLCPQCFTRLEKATENVMDNGEHPCADCGDTEGTVYFERDDAWACDSPSDCMERQRDAALGQLRGAVDRIARLEQQLRWARQVCSDHGEEDGDDCEECRQMVADIDTALGG